MAATMKEKQRQESITIFPRFSTNAFNTSRFGTPGGALGADRAAQGTTSGLSHLNSTRYRTPSRNPVTLDQFSFLVLPVRSTIPRIRARPPPACLHPSPSLPRFPIDRKDCHTASHRYDSVCDLWSLRQIRNFS
ncbi:hypothetical protein VTL71DRAFT_16178, partial [Oculimacula yallundae]